MFNEAGFIFLGILWAKIDILKNRRKYQLKYTFLIATMVHFPNLKENPGQPYLLLEM